MRSILDRPMRSGQRAWTLIVTGGPLALVGPENHRTRATYPDRALMIEHRRVEALGDALMPDWLAVAS